MCVYALVIISSSVEQLKTKHTKMPKLKLLGTIAQIKSIVRNADEEEL